MLRAAALLALAPLLLACGGGAPGEEPAPGTSGEARSGAASTPGAPAQGGTAQGGPVTGPTQGGGALDESLRPAAPARNFNSRYKVLGGWYEELVARISPAHAGDRWPTEVISGLARRELRRGFLAALSGEEPPWATVLGPRFRAHTALRPAQAERVHERGGQIDRAQLEPLDEADARARDAGALLADLLAPYHAAGQPVDVKLWVLAAWQEAPGFHTRVRLRLSSGGLQTTVDLVARWRVADGRVLLAAVVGQAFEEVRFQEPPLADVTAHVLGAAAEEGGWLWEGALERSATTDRVVPFTDVYLGMHGLGVGDLDGDGLEDVYVARQGGAPNQLLLHQPDGTVVDGAAAAGVDLLDDTSGVLIVDLDGDGARDLVLGIGVDVVVLWNDGAGRFPETSRLSREAPDLDKVYTVTAADADGDGDLDLYDTRYFSGNYSAGGGVPTPYHDATNGARNSLWRNEGERRLVEATADLGLDASNDRFSLTSLWEDLDGDGDLDLYVVNDFGRNNLYLRGDDGRYADAAGERGLADMAAGMGITCADANGDGVLDLYVTNMFSAAGARVTATPKFAGVRGVEAAGYQRHTRGNSLLLGRGDGRFLDGTEAGGTGPGGWAWGAVFADLDCDGAPDLYVPNGFLTGPDPRDLQGFFWRQVVGASPLGRTPTEAYLNAWQAITRLSQRVGYSWNGNEHNYVYWNLGDAVFADATRASGGGVPDDSRVAAPCDWNGDGRVDLWVKNRTAPLVRLLENRVQGAGRWLTLELVDGAPNTEAIGARVTLTTGERTHVRRVYAGEGYLGTPSKRLHFGLGDAEVVDRLEVVWPDGGRTELMEVALDTAYRLRRSGALEPLDRGSPVAAAARPLARSNGTPGSRTVALERLPFGPVPLPRFDGVQQTIADRAGQTLLVVLWASWDEGCDAVLADLARAGEDLSAAGVHVHPVTLDSVRDEGFAKEVLAASGLKSPGGRAGMREQVLYEIACAFVLADYDDLELPVALHFDAAGRLSVAHVGAVDLAAVAADSRTLLESDEQVGTLCLTGGRWLRQPRRAVARTAERLASERGERELAAALLAFDESRED